MRNIFILFLFTISCASYDPDVKVNELKHCFLNLNHVLVTFYDSINRSQDENDIRKAFGKYLYNLDSFYNEISLFIDQNQNLVSSKCWKNQFDISIKEIFENNKTRKQISDKILLKYDPELIQSLNKKCEDQITIYSYKLTKKIQDIQYEYLSDLKDPYTVVYERKSDGFVDIIFEKDCSRYIGYVKNGVFNGKGRLITKDGSSVGTWVNGRGNGYFEYTHNDGTIMRCNLIDDKEDGEVIIEWPDGRVTRSFYKNGVEILSEK
jgi:hypothetical protein